MSCGACVPHLHVWRTEKSKTKKKGKNRGIPGKFSRIDHNWQAKSFEKSYQKLVLADRQFVHASLINFIWLLERNAKRGSEVQRAGEKGLEVASSWHFVQ